MATIEEVYVIEIQNIYNWATNILDPLFSASVTRTEEIEKDERDGVTYDTTGTKKVSLSPS